jgi:hypothetical protein
VGLRVLKWHIKRLVRYILSQSTSDKLLGRESTIYHLWSIGIYAGHSPHRFYPSSGIQNPVLTREQVSDVRALFVADPFMVRSRDIWYMFFEVYNYDTDKGEIGLATSKDGFKWKYEQIVLTEPFHLSYPYVFEWDGRFYMIPESHQAHSIRLYQSHNFPTEWICNDVLIKGQRFSDSSLFRYGNYWWLLCETSAKMEHDTLSLYFSPDLRGRWQEHPVSPIIQANPHIARPAGRVTIWQNRIIRFAQDCSPTYGTRVRAFEITELSTSSYQERPLSRRSILGPRWGEWNFGGMHHLDPHPLESGKWIASVDGWQPVWWLVPEGWERVP